MLAALPPLCRIANQKSLPSRRYTKSIPETIRGAPCIRIFQCIKAIHIWVMNRNKKETSNEKLCQKYNLSCKRSNRKGAGHFCLLFVGVQGWIMRRLAWRNGAENTKLFDSATRQLGFIICYMIFTITILIIVIITHPIINCIVLRGLLVLFWFKKIKICWCSCWKTVFLTLWKFWRKLESKNRSFEHFP